MTYSNAAWSILWICLLGTAVVVKTDPTTTTTTPQARFAHPIQLIAPSGNNRTGLRVNEEGLAQLALLEGPVAAVAVVGPYHTGKSFLLSNLVAKNRPSSSSSSSSRNKVVVEGERSGHDDNPVFEVGQSVDPLTAGIWAYHQRVKLPNSTEPVDLLYLDTEGFAVANVSERYDGKVFAATAVLSSLLVYNTLGGVIDGHSLEYLDLLAHNTQLFSLKTATKFANTTDQCLNQSSSSSRYSLHEMMDLPPLVWAVQAFTIDLQGETCSDWLGRLLAGSVSSSPRPDGSHRLGIQGLFPTTRCHTLFLPATSRAQLHRLSELRWSNMTPEFLEDLNSLHYDMMSLLRPKTRGNVPIIGVDFAALVRIVVDAIETGTLADIPSRWTLFEGHLRESSVQAAIRHFETEANLGFRNRSRPLNTVDMKSLLSRVRVETLDLVPRLFQGFDKDAYKAASDRVKSRLLELAIQLQKDNDRSIKFYLKEMRQKAIEDDDKRVEQLMTKLPDLSSTVQTWLDDRKKDVMDDLNILLEDYKQESTYRSELSQVSKKLEANSKKVQDHNQVVMEAKLEEEQQSCLKEYSVMSKDLMKRCPHLPTDLSTNHTAFADKTLNCVMTKWGGFMAEKKRWNTHKSRLDKRLAQLSTTLHQDNSVCLTGYCQGRRQEVVANISAMMDANMKLIEETGLNSLLVKMEGQREEFIRASHPFDVTKECKAVAKELWVDISTFQERQRVVTTENLRVALSQPLQEICKVVVEAKCQGYMTVKGLNHFIKTECTKWISRDQQLGSKLHLSPTLMNRVIQSFTRHDLTECVDHVRRVEDTLTRKWALGMAAFFFFILIPFFIKRLGAPEGSSNGKGGKEVSGTISQ